MLFGNSVVKDKKEAEEMRNLEEKNNVVISVYFNTRSWVWAVSVFGVNVPCSGNFPEIQL